MILSIATTVVLINKQFGFTISRPANTTQEQNNQEETHSNFVLLAKSDLERHNWIFAIRGNILLINQQKN